MRSTKKALRNKNKFKVQWEICGIKWKKNVDVWRETDDQWQKLTKQKWTNITKNIKSSSIIIMANVHTEIPGMISHQILLEYWNSVWNYHQTFLENWNYIWNSHQIFLEYWTSIWKVCLQSLWLFPAVDAIYQCFSSD